MVEKATGKLPLASSEGIRFLNRFLTQEQKEKMFYMMTEGTRTDTDKARPTAPTNNEARNQQFKKPILLKTLNFD